MIIIFSSTLINNLFLYSLFETEFGKSLIAKAGAIVAAVEDVLPIPPSPNNQLRCTAITHAGADLMLRTAYCPDMFAHRFVHLPSRDIKCENESTPYLVTIVGPLCFGGDILLSDMPVICRPMPKDCFLALDAGANTISMFSRHCSRPAPAVYAFRQCNKVNATISGCRSEELVITCIKPQETEDELFHFWG